jgi:hypothetical protein
MGYYFGKKNEKKKDSGDQRDRYPLTTFFNFFVLLKLNKHLENCHMLSTSPSLPPSLPPSVPPSPSLSFSI